ncbi:MAG: hypothetical protein K0R15_849 [Clostridiales bacterium]|jgi:hypothetical protein|nr:hypothetical protein [Clostridiales bacterium]
MSKKIIFNIIIYCFLAISLTSCSKSNKLPEDKLTSTTSEDNANEDNTYENDIVNTDIYDWGILLPEERYMKLDTMFSLLSNTGVDTSLFPSYDDALLMIEEQLELDIKQTNIFDCLCLGIGVDPTPYHPVIDKVNN